MLARKPVSGVDGRCKSRSIETTDGCSRVGWERNRLAKLFSGPRGYLKHISTTLRSAPPFSALRAASPPARADFPVNS